MTASAGLLVFVCAFLPAKQPGPYPYEAPLVWAPYGLGLSVALAALPLPTPALTILLRAVLYPAIAWTALIATALYIIPPYTFVGWTACLGALAICGFRRADERAAIRAVLASTTVALPWFGFAIFERHDGYGTWLSVAAALAMLVGAVTWRIELARDERVPPSVEAPRSRSAMHRWFTAAGGIATCAAMFVPSPEGANVAARIPLMCVPFIFALSVALLALRLPEVVRRCAVLAACGAVVTIAHEPGVLVGAVVAAGVCWFAPRSERRTSDLAVATGAIVAPFALCALLLNWLSSSGHAGPYVAMAGALAMFAGAVMWRPEVAVGVALPSATAKPRKDPQVTREHDRNDDGR